MAEEQLDFFRDIIIDHSQFPRGHGQIDAPTHEGIAENPLCGDRIKLQLVVNSDDIIEDLVFSATGCAMSLASASMLVTYLKGKTVTEAAALFSRVHALFTEQDTAPEQELPDELAALAVARRYPARVKCVTMPWHHLNRLLESGAGTLDSVY